MRRPPRHQRHANEPDGLVTDYDLGSSIEEIRDNFPNVLADTISRIVAFSHSHQPA
jgi:uncharacterized protein (DUF433 family)